MFEYLTLLLPFLLLGFIAAGLSRISGVALSMIIVPTLLIWGATPLDVVAFMLLFVVYNNFTSETKMYALITRISYYFLNGAC